MKKTLFLAAVLAASLGFSNVTCAEEYDPDDFQVYLSDGLFGNNILDVEDYEDDDNISRYEDEEQDNTYYILSVLVDSEDGQIRNGGFSGRIVIDEGAKLSIPGADDEYEIGILLQNPSSSFADKYNFPTGWTYNNLLSIHMCDDTSLSYTYGNIYLGALTFDEGANVTIGNNILAREVGAEYIKYAHEMTRDFEINAHITAVAGAWEVTRTLVMDSFYAKSVTLGYDLPMNLEVQSNFGVPTIKDGKIELNLDAAWGGKDYYRLQLNSKAGSDAKIILPDSDGINPICKIDSYLGGTATISLGNNTLQGRDEVSESGNHYVSWLTNNIEVRENCSATMTAGYYGGNITMLEGSSLKFDMLVAPAGVDSEHWNGGVKVRMNGGNTLDLAGKKTTLDLTVTGQENKNTLKNGTFAGTAVITDGSLALPVNMDPNAKVTLQGDAMLDLEGQKLAFGLTVTGDGNKLANGEFIGTLTLEEDSTLVSDSAMKSWDGPTAIVMKDGSTLEMATGDGKDRWINDVSKLEVNGEATVVNAYLRIKPGTTYTLGNGVQNLKGEGRSFLSLDNSTLDLDGAEISKLYIGVWSAFAPYDNVVKNGTLNTYVEIDPKAKLTLQNVTIGDDASFAMRDKTQLDLGGESVKLDKVTLAEDATATVDNGTLWIGTWETVTLDPNLVGSYALDLRGGTLQLDNATLTRDTIVSGVARVNGGTVDNSIQILGTSDERPISKLWLEEDVTIGDNATFTMGNGAKLDMSGNTARLSKFTLEESATAYVYGGTLFVGEGEEATLNPNLLGSCVLELRGGTLNLGTNTLDRKANVTGDATIGNGKIDFAVNIDSSRKLSLQGVTVASNAAFTMGDGAQMNLGQVKEEYTVTTQTASWLQERNGIGLNMFKFTGESARIDNGTLFVGDHVAGFNETVTLGTDLTGSADMKLDYYKTCLKFGGHKWTKTQSNGTEIFTMEDNTGHTGSIFGEANVKATGLVGQYVQEKVQVQGVKLTTKSDFRVEKAVISGSLIDIGVGTKLFLVDVDIKADTHFTDDTATLSVDNSNAWLEQDVNTFVAGSETVAADTTLRMSGDKSDTPQSITMAAGSQVINLTCDMFDSVTLTGDDVWLDMTDIAERGTLLGYGYVTIDFGHVGEQLGDVLKRAMVDARNLSVYAKLVDDKGQAYTERAYYDPATLSGGYAPRLFFKLVPTPEPTTGTLSLLALAALAARRRKHN